MQFQSYLFILAFLPIVLLLYWFMRRRGLSLPAKLVLLCANFVFCGWVNPLYLLYFVVMPPITLCLGRAIRGDRRSKPLLVIGIVLHVGLLVYCKYTNFFLRTLNALFDANCTLVALFVPLGISFVTFQQISYLVDRYRGEAPCYSLLDYMIYASFFPTVSSGPIALHNEVIPPPHHANDTARHAFNQERFARGLYGFSLGLGKKMLLAELFGGAANWGFGADFSTMGSVDALIVMLSYTLQIYFDFSAYSDMAIGVARMLNIELPQNFNAPYRALDIDDFWKRWHMTLTRFFTRYVYIPMGGNRKGTLRTYVNIIVVFLISGLWHGANVTFLVWGLLHAMGSVCNRIFKERIQRWHPALRWMLTFCYVSMAWVFFRADSLSQALDLFRAIGRLQLSSISAGLISAFSIPLFDNLKILLGVGAFPNVVYPCLIVLGVGICLNAKTVDERLAVFRGTWVQALLCVLLLVSSILSFSSVTEFLYMAF